MHTQLKRCCRAMREANVVGPFLLAIAGIFGCIWVLYLLFTSNGMDVVRRVVCVPVDNLFGPKGQYPCLDAIGILILGLIAYGVAFALAMFAEFYLNPNLTTFVRIQGRSPSIEWLDFEGQSYLILYETHHPTTGVDVYCAYHGRALIRSCVAWFVGSICAITIACMGGRMIFVALAQFIVQPLSDLAANCAPKNAARCGPLVHLAVICAAYTIICIISRACCIVGQYVIPLLIGPQRGHPCALGYVSILAGVALMVFDIALCGVYFMFYSACANDETQIFTIAGTVADEGGAKEQIPRGFVVYDCERRPAYPDQIEGHGVTRYANFSDPWHAQALHWAVIARYACEWLFAHAMVALIRAFVSKSVLLSIFAQLSIPAICDALFIAARACRHWAR